MPNPAWNESATIFFDDFAGGDLDRDVWNVRETGTVVNDEVQAYVDAPDTVYVTPIGDESTPIGDESTSGGTALALHPLHRPRSITAGGQVFDFISGRIDTRDRFQFGYGLAAARMKLPIGSGLWPAFWMMGLGTWPETGEIDVMEFVGEADWTSAGVHGPGYSGESGLINARFFPAGETASDWHVYSVERGPDQLVFRVDGAVVHRVTRPMVEFFGSWEFDDPKFLILNVAIGGTYPFKTNGVRSPYYGLPADTLDLIAADRVRVLVDWVRVTSDIPST